MQRSTIKNRVSQVLCSLLVAGSILSAPPASADPKDSYTGTYFWALYDAGGYELRVYAGIYTNGNGSNNLAPGTTSICVTTIRGGEHAGKCGRGEMLAAATGDVGVVDAVLDGYEVHLTFTASGNPTFEHVVESPPGVTTWYQRPIQTVGTIKTPVGTGSGTARRTGFSVITHLAG